MNTGKRLHRALVAVAILVPLGLWLLLGAQRRAEQRFTKDQLAGLMREWENQVRERMDRDESLRPLAAKYPLVVLHSWMLKTDDSSVEGQWSNYSFVYETNDRTISAQLVFQYGGHPPRTFNLNPGYGRHNLIADLGEVDFEKDPNPKQIDIDGEGTTWLKDGNHKAVEGHVYLEKIRDWYGNSFYVLFKVVAVDPGSRYMAFIWRRLPGGKIVKPEVPPKEEVLKLVHEWEKQVQEKIRKDESLLRLSAKYPLVLLHSRVRYTTFDHIRETRWSAYNFVYETSDESRTQEYPNTGGPGHLVFDSSGGWKAFDVNIHRDQQNLVADLGPADFEKDPDPKQVDMDDGRVTWLPGNCVAVEGHVYLERIRDRVGNRFYVLFKVVDVDPNGRYMAFIWRRLPGGIIVKNEQPAKAELVRLTDEWKEQVREKISKDESLKRLTAKYSFVLLQSRFFNNTYRRWSGYNFIYETNDMRALLARNPKLQVHARDEAHLVFDNGGNFWRPTFDITTQDQQNLVADLGNIDFEKDPDPKAIDIDSERGSWFGDRVEAIEGHVYLERIRDSAGNRFYVLFKVIDVDPDSKYMAFIWRRLPGGKIVKPEPLGQ